MNRQHHVLSDGLVSLSDAGWFSCFWTNDLTVGSHRTMMCQPPLSRGLSSTGWCRTVSESRGGVVFSIELGPRWMLKLRKHELQGDEAIVLPNRETRYLAGRAAARTCAALC